MIFSRPISLHKCKFPPDETWTLIGWRFDHLFLISNQKAKISWWCFVQPPGETHLDLVHVSGFRSVLLFGACLGLSARRRSRSLSAPVPSHRSVAKAAERRELRFSCRSAPLRAGRQQTERSRARPEMLRHQLPEPHTPTSFSGFSQ